MKRREFLATSLAMAWALGTGTAWAQPGRPKVRAAVVIGVNKPGDLPKLDGAASGARAVAQWLRDEGFSDVKLFADDEGPVRAVTISDAVGALVDRGTLDQLVIYFAGHGYIGHQAEYWMLSHAPRDSNDAISLLESKVLASRSAIPSVVFISDCCRSLPDSLQTQSMRGTVIFPNPGVMAAVHSNVDVFMATLVGETSLEVPVAESAGAYEGVYTAAFLAAYKRPDDDMVLAVNDLRVVPNNHLQPYLEREVGKRVRMISPLYTQTPDADVVSGNDTYIGRVSAATPSTVAAASPVPAPAPPPAPVLTREAQPMPAPRLPSALSREAQPMARRSSPPTIASSTAAMAERPASALSAYVTAAPTIRDVANDELLRVGVRGPGPSKFVAPEAIAELNEQAGFEKKRDRLLRAGNTGPLGFETGFTISGAKVQLALARPGIRRQVVSPGDGSEQAAKIRIDMGGARAASVAIRFGNGTGTVIAALKGFIGSIVVDEAGVSNVSYFPSEGNPLWQEYNGERDRIGKLHAAIATAARFGVFRIQGGAEGKASAGERLASTIRTLKDIDPTLGLYAAYAYTDAGLQRQVQSVRDYMRGDLQADLFDVAMLSGALAGRSPDGTDATVPFCPMLSQGWGYLRVQEVHVPAEVNAAQDHLRSALWTTFDEEGIQIVLAAMQAGKLR
jgi:hypothetical protein